MYNPAVRVLCVDPHPTAHSETYISSEMAWMQRHGVEVGFWAKGGRFAPGPAVRAVSGPLMQAVVTFRPNVLHFYTHVHPDTVEPFINDLLSTGLPVTIRGHSYGFNVSVYQQLRAVARIWLFPHHAALVEQENVEPLPVTFDQMLYYPEEPERRVVRAGAARPGKDVEGFLRVATLCPSVPFVLIVTGADTAYLETVQAQAPANVRVHLHLPHASAAALMRRSWVCLRSHDTLAHAYGMPISIAEAMGSGLPVIARAADPESPSRFGPESYIGDAGFYYETHEEAAQLVRQIIEWPRETWNAARNRSLKQAEKYRPDAVLPRVLQVWNELI